MGVAAGTLITAVRSSARIGRLIDLKDHQILAQNIQIARRWAKLAIAATGHLAHRPETA